MQVKHFMRQFLPDYRLPSALAWLNEFPLSPALAQAAVQRVADPAASDNPLERAMEAIWQDLLEVNDIQSYDTFFDLGGHSLLAVKAVERFERETGVRVNPNDLINQTLRQIISAIEARGKAQSASEEKRAGAGILGAFNNTFSKE